MIFEIFKIFMIFGINTLGYLNNLINNFNTFAIFKIFMIFKIRCYPKYLKYHKYQFLDISFLSLFLILFLFSYYIIIRVTLYYLSIFFDFSSLFNSSTSLFKSSFFLFTNSSFLFNKVKTLEIVCFIKRISLTFFNCLLASLNLKSRNLSRVSDNILCNSLFFLFFNSLNSIQYNYFVINLHLTGSL